MFTLLALRNEGSLEGIAATPAPSLFPSSVNSVSLCLALFFRPSTLISAPSLFSLFATKRKKLTPLFSYSSALFCIIKNTISIPFNLFRTLCTKHPGWGASCSSLVRRDRPTLIHLLERCSTILPLSAGCQLSAVSSPVSAFSSPNVDALDAASSISPLFATLTKNTGGWGTLRS